MPHLHWKRYSDTVQCTVFTVDRLSVEIVLVNKEFVQIIAVFIMFLNPVGQKKGPFLRFLTLCSMYLAGCRDSNLIIKLDQLSGRKMTPESI